MVIFQENIGLATNWVRILSVSPIDKIRTHLVANPILLLCTIILSYLFNVEARKSFQIQNVYYTDI